ncbi:hypothetical protein BDZ97DRAFT_671967 [Flammula alnicola]|nr:hypothetical protein BDZ97DRAFT_671967 [Flammula alnicola]
MAFSGALTLTDLNDFITPSQACIKPLSRPTHRRSRSGRRVQRRQRSSSTPAGRTTNKQQTTPSPNQPERLSRLQRLHNLRRVRPHHAPIAHGSAQLPRVQHRPRERSGQEDPCHLDCATVACLARGVSIRLLSSLARLEEQ